MLMELHQLEYFVHVAQTGSFTRAAARSHVSQPGVSAQVRRLEREVGEALFDRTQRTVRLTESGEALLPYARAALAAVAEGQQAVDEIRGLVRGSVRAGVMANLPSLRIADLLASFRDQYPDVQISLTDGRSPDLVDQLRSGVLDVAIIGLPGTLPEGIQAHPIHSEPLVIATGRGDPLARRKRVGLTALRDRPLISLPRGSGLRTFLEEACAEAGFEPEVAIEAGDPQLLIELTARGLGVCLVPRSMAEPHRERLHILGTARPTLHGRVVLAWRAAGPHGPAARRFINEAKRRLPANATRPSPATSSGPG